MSLFFKVSTYHLLPERTTITFKAVHENCSPALSFALKEVGLKHCVATQPDSYVAVKTKGVSR